MKPVAYGYAIILILLGVIGYLVTGAESITALIPSFFGAIVLIIALIGLNEKWYKHTIHIITLLALVAVIATFSGITDTFQLMGGADIQRPAAAVSKALMAVFSLIFLILAIRSFIQARRSE
ncbi:MAG: hypothetical protein GF313_09155 [Caldithrix sp.]|nr:hypothetical protein [Caldithrix sp.]